MKYEIIINQIYFLEYKEGSVRVSCLLKKYVLTFHRSKY